MLRRVSILILIVLSSNQILSQRYIAFDSRRTGITFDWIDTTGGTLLSGAMVRDDDTTVVHLPFTFRFYSIGYDSMWVSSNGLITFFPDSAAIWRNHPIPNTASPNAYIAPYWDDLRPIPAGTTLPRPVIYFKTGGSPPNRWVAIIWANIFRYSYRRDGITFEAILYENPTGNGKIAFQYLDVEWAGSTAISFGASATVGIENRTGTEGVQYLYNSPILRDSMRIEFIDLSSTHDIAALGVELFPVTPIPSLITITPKAIITDLGGYDEDLAKAKITIIGDTAGIIYQESVTFNIDTAETNLVPFPTLSFSVPDSYTAVVAIHHPADSFPFDDTSETRFFVAEHFASGGPDASGFRWYDNFYPDTEAARFLGIDLAGATQLTLSGDDVTTTFDLPFPFPYYDRFVRRIWISSNGFISVSSVSSALPTNDTLPTGSIRGAIAPFWDDHYIRTSASPPSSVYVKSGLTPDSIRYFSVIWRQSYLPYSSTTDYCTYEARLFENGEILFQYGPSHSGSGVWNNLYGKSATIGISSPDGRTSLIYEFNGNPPGNPIFPGLAIRFVPSTIPRDTIGPVIVHYSQPVIYFCDDAGGYRFTVSANDPMGISADTMYVWVNGHPRVLVSYMHVDENFYYWLDSIFFGDTIEYYFVFWDDFVIPNRSVFPAGAPAVKITTIVGNPHIGGDTTIAAFIDSRYDSTFAPEFDWVEIDPAAGGYGTIIDSTHDDLLSNPINIGGLVWFFEPIYSHHVKISTNGWLTFDLSYTSGRPSTGYMPSALLPNFVIAPLWVDLIPRPPHPATMPYGKVIAYDDTANNRFIVEWKHVYPYGDSSGVNATFEVMIPYFDDIDEIPHVVSIIAQYLHVPSVLRRRPTIGIENMDGDGVAYVNAGYPPACLPYDSSAVKFYILTPYSISSPKKPDEVIVSDVVPNPFNSSAKITLDLPKSSIVRAEIYDTKGRLVQKLCETKLLRGKYTLCWTPYDNICSGIYIMRISVGEKIFTRKFVFTK